MQIPKEYRKRVMTVSKHYGYNVIVDQSIEEMGELIQALQKYKRAAGIGQPLSEPVTEQDCVYRIREEIADVQITLWELLYLMGSSLDFMIDSKLNRSMSLIEDENKEEAE